MADDVPGWGVQLQTEVAHLQDTLTSHVKENRETHKDLYQRTERPSWTVAWVLTIMGGLVGSLAVWALTNSG